MSAADMAPAYAYGMAVSLLKAHEMDRRELEMPMCDICSASHTTANHMHPDKGAPICSPCWRGECGESLMKCVDYDSKTTSKCPCNCLGRRDGNGRQ